MSLKSQKFLFLKKPIIFLFISLIKSLSCSDDLITVRRNQPNLIHHKNGDFILKIENYEEEYGWGCCSGARALLENLTNFDLYKFPPDSRGITYYHYNSFDYKKYWHPNSIEIETNDKVYSNNAVNHIVCKILYYTKYISHMIYSVSIDKDYNPYLLNFGGTLEQNISQSDMKKIVTFKKNDTFYFMGKCIVFVNQKGGVGKTTSAINIGAYIALAGKKVLLVDFDSQGNMSSGVGVSKDKPTIYELLAGQVDADKAIKKTTVENLDAISASIDLSGVAIELADQEDREFYLKNALEPLKAVYDYILIDCMPSLGMMTINALVAADSVIIPSQPSFLSTKGLNLLLHSVSKVKRSINPGLKIDGILLTMVDSRTNNARDIIEALRTGIGQNIRVFETEIPHSVRAAECSLTGESIFSHDRNGKVAAAYEALTKEVEDIERAAKNRSGHDWVR